MNLSGRQIYNIKTKYFQIYIFLHDFHYLPHIIVMAISSSMRREKTNGYKVLED